VRTYPYYLANKSLAPNHDVEVTDKYSGEIVARVAVADAKAIDTAIAAAAAAQASLRKLPAYRRQEVLLHCVDRFKKRFDELALSLCMEAGKPIKDARGEVARLIDTFRIAAEESVRMVGEVIPLEISPRARGYQAFGSAFQSDHARLLRRSIFH
jgi:acyl-CoA reductase-like NAD-dependent aldehyde dehydrogenase